MYNVANRNVENHTPDSSSNIQYISALTLFKQQYSVRILERWDALQESPSHRDSLIAYNRAVKEMFQELRIDQPEELQALEETVERMRAAQQQEFHEQPEDMQHA
jgi:hypothetical protein